MDHSPGKKPRLGAAAADANLEVILSGADVEVEVERLAKLIYLFLFLSSDLCIFPNTVATVASDACLYASAVVKVDTAPLTNASTADAPPAPSSLPEHEHPLAGEALAWTRHIYADPLMQRLEAIGALLDLELMIVPPVPRSEIMAALDELVTGLPTVDPAPGPQEEIDIQWLDGNLQPPPLSP
jgi:hypothetical protein